MGFVDEVLQTLRVHQESKMLIHLAFIPQHSTGVITVTDGQKGFLCIHSDGQMDRPNHGFQGRSVRIEPGSVR